MRKPAFLQSLLFLLLLTAPAAGAGRVQLELVGDAQMGAGLGFQQWLQALSRAGIDGVRIRAAQGEVKVGIEVRGTEQNPVYVVTGLITARNELVVPGGKFTQGQTGRLKEWLDDLAQKGLPERREAKAAFGLSEKQFETAREDLGQPLAFDTKDMTRAEAVRKIGGQLANPTRIEGELEGGGEKVVEELSGLSSGTALAYLLRPIGYCLTPRETSGRLAYSISRVSKEQLDREVWPVGWAPDKPPAEVAPALYEFRNVNVQGVSAARVLAAVGQQIKLPVLLDYNALARHGIEPEKTVVSHPQQRTNYSLALRKILFKAGMKFELRVDEAGNPFLWVTSVKPV